MTFMMEATVDERRLSGTARRGSNAPVPSDTGVTLGGTALLVVDPQLDFHEGGSLAVPGATADSERTAKFIAKHSEIIDELIITLDSHQVSHSQLRVLVWDGPCCPLC